MLLLGFASFPNLAPQSAVVKQLLSHCRRAFQVAISRNLISGLHGMGLAKIADSAELLPVSIAWVSLLALGSVGFPSFVLTQFVRN